MQFDRSQRDARLYRLVVESASEYAIFTMDLDLRITSWNSGAERVLGWSEAEAIGRGAEIIFTAEDRARRVCRSEADRTLTEGRSDDIRWHQRKTGERFWANGVMLPLKDDCGEIVGLLKILRDRTEEKRATDELRELNDTLEQRVAEEVESRLKVEEVLLQAQKMEAVGQLTGGLAHDFNNMLTAIAVSLEMIEKKVRQGCELNLDRYIHAAQAATTRAAAVTNRLLSFSRRQTLDPRVTEVNALLRSLYEMVQSTIGPHIRLEMELDESISPTLCDPHQLENAVVNLCINARDAMPDGGVLRIITSGFDIDEAGARERGIKPGHYVAISVADTGEGMPHHVVERAFDPFFTTKPIGSGTGLGLSMVYGFARQSGGKVRIFSEINKGTMVRVLLPSHGEASSAGDEEGSGSVTMSDALNSGTVLVVDDEEVVRMVIVDLLKEIGYVVLEAEDGAAGLKILESDVRVDLLVTDVGLPRGMNGRQLADAGRSLRPDLRVMFITGYAESVVFENDSLSAGMSVLAKPFTMTVLAERVRAEVNREPLIKEAPRPS